MVIGRGGKGRLQAFALACDIQSTETTFPQVVFMQEDVFNRSSAFETKLQELGPLTLS